MIFQLLRVILPYNYRLLLTSNTNQMLITFYFIKFYPSDFIRMAHVLIEDIILFAWVVEELYFWIFVSHYENIRISSGQLKRSDITLLHTLCKYPFCLCAEWKSMCWPVKGFSLLIFFIRYFFYFDWLFLTAHAWNIIQYILAFRSIETNIIGHLIKI